jgi:hypothetical protein
MNEGNNSLNPSPGLNLQDDVNTLAAQPFVIRPPAAGLVRTLDRDLDLRSRGRPLLHPGRQRRPQGLEDRRRHHPQPVRRAAVDGGARRQWLRFQVFAGLNMTFR